MISRITPAPASPAAGAATLPAGAVEEILDQAGRNRHRLYLTVVNWAEVFYSRMRKTSSAVAEEQARIVASLPIDIIGVGDDLRLTRQAAIYEATHRLSLADAFAAALAKERKAELVTGDPEVNTRPSLGHPGASSGASGPSDRFADRARGIAEKSGASSGEWTRLRFKAMEKESKIHWLT